MKVILGAGGTIQDGWVSTDKAELDLLNPASWASYFNSRLADAFLAEHVFEHFTLQEAVAAARNARTFLRPQGTLRIAVPDRLHPDPWYIRWTEPGGTGPGAPDHKAFYDLETLASLLAEAGFTEVKPLEWWGSDRRFHALPWSPDLGLVRRSAQHDSRNQAKPLTYTSLIVDGVR